jgi:2-keto-4-pentenoate hydratase/2-oxohepta-3-ene-1,7-dioic acid hydratase in catechol pathway
MKICRCTYRGKTRFGIVEHDRVSFLKQDPLVAVERTGDQAALDDVELLAPVVPPNVIAIGTNYMGHVAETNAPRPERPLVFLKATTSVTDPGRTIELPRMAPDEVDYEAELVIVIGKKARHVAPEDALDVVFGYTCANDVSARDCQKKLDRQWARAKSFDTFCPLGPWIETELDPADVRVTTRLNGQTMQDSTTANLIFDCPTLISYLSDAMTLLPGTLILTGTPDGVGMAQDPPRYLRQGDVVEVEVGGIGVLRNPVGNEP